MTGPDELQQRLTRLAERTAPPPREDLAGVVVARARSQRRQRAGLTALVAAVAAVTVAVPLAVDGAPAGLTSADGAVATSTPGPTWSALPTRGSLAGDAAFVEGVRQLPWTSDDATGTGVPDAPLDSRRVVFAGEVGGLRVALVAGANDAQPEPPFDDPELQTDLAALSDVALAWFTGPAGAGPAEMALATLPTGADPRGGPAALFVADSGALVVVAEPGDQVGLSLRPEVAADGSVSRDYQPVDAPEGIATATLPPGSTSGVALRYQTVRGTETWTSSPSATPLTDGRAVVEVPWLRPAPAPSSVDVVARPDALWVLDRLGLAAADVEQVMLWSGDVPSPTDPPSRVGLLATTLPSGAVHLEAAIGVQVGTSEFGGSDCGTGFRPAGTTPAELTVALRCDATDMSGYGDVVSSLVVVAPAQAVTARARALDGSVVAEFDLADGVAVVPFPGRTGTVETLAADGTVLASTELLGSADLGD